MSCSHKSHLKGSGEPFKRLKALIKLEVHPYSSCALLWKLMPCLLFKL